MFYYDRVYLTGTITALLNEFEYYNRVYQKIILSVRRRSGFVDNIFVTIRRKLFDASACVGQKIRIEGELRKADDFYVSAKYVEQVPLETEDHNWVEAKAKVDRIFRLRKTSYTEREVIDIKLYYFKYQYRSIFCVAWGKTAHFVDKYIREGNDVRITGRLYPKVYKNEANSHVENQVSICRIEPIT